MFELLKNVISLGNYKLSDMLYKVKKLYIMGDLTEDELTELLAMTSKGVSTDAERPDVLNMLKSLADRVEAIEKRLNDSEPESGEDLDETVVYEAWAPWDGMSNKYQYGAIVSHNGGLWRSIFNGQNVWEPGAVGTSGLWEVYTPEE